MNIIIKIIISMSNEIFELILLTSFVTISCIFILAISKFYYNNTEEDLIKLDYVKFAWEKSPIIDIQLSRIICPIDFLPIRLYFNNEDTNTNKISYNYGYNETTSTIGDTQNYYTYRNSLICAKRMKVNYFDFFPIYFTDKYGDNQLDFFANRIEKYTEVVSQVYVIDIDEPTPNGFFRRNFYDNKKSLIFKIANDRPIINFRIQQGELCAHPLEFDIKKSTVNNLNQSKNKFNGCKTKIGGLNKNPHFTWIDNDSINNNFNNRYQINDFTGNNKDLNLYYQQYPGMNNTCISLLPHFSTEGSVGSTYGLPLKYGVANIILAYIIMFSVIGFALLIFCFDCFGCNEDSKECIIIIAVITIVAIAISSIIITWIFFSMFTTNLYTQYLSYYSYTPKYGFRMTNDVFNMSCFDYFTSEYLIHLKDVLNNSYVSMAISSTIITLLTVATVLLPIILPIIHDMYNLD